MFQANDPANEKACFARQIWFEYETSRRYWSQKDRDRTV